LYFFHFAARVRWNCFEHQLERHWEREDGVQATGWHGVQEVGILTLTTYLLNGLMCDCIINFPGQPVIFCIYCEYCQEFSSFDDFFSVERVVAAYMFVTQFHCRFV